MNTPLKESHLQPMTVSLQFTPQIESELERSLKKVEEAQQLVAVVDSPMMAQEVADEMGAIKRRIAEVEKMRKGFLEPAQQIIENARALFNPALEALREAEAICKRGLAVWNEKEQKRIADENAKREAEQRRARQEAEQRAAAERAKAEELARQREAEARAAAEAKAAAERREREAAEAQRRAIEEGNKEAARIAAEQRRKANEEAQARAAAEAKAREQAASAVENGEARAREAQMAAAATTQAPAATVTKIAGHAMRDNWEAELAPGVIDAVAAKKLIVQAATAGREDLYGLILIDDKAMDKMAKALKSAMSVPGYVAKNNPRSVAARR